MMSPRVLDLPYLEESEFDMSSKVNVISPAAAVERSVEDKSNPVGFSPGYAVLHEAVGNSENEYNNEILYNSISGIRSPDKIINPETTPVLNT
jgi:hypothetical protein